MLLERFRTRTDSLFCRRLLEFYVIDDSFSKPEILDLIDIKMPPEINLTGTIWHLTLTHHHFHGSTPFLALHLFNPRLVFDIRTRIFYTFPPYHDTPILVRGRLFVQSKRTHCTICRINHQLMSS